MPEEPRYMRHHDDPATCGFTPIACNSRGFRHCWVAVPDSPGRWAGLLAEWRQDTQAGGWQGRVVYAVDGGSSTVLVEAWVHARHLQPVTG